MFVGRHARNLDRKSRLAIPAEYVNRLLPEDRAEVYVTPGKNGCIFIVPKSYWDKEFEQLAKEYRTPVPDEYYHHCQLRPVDKAGRLLLDEHARGLGGLADPSGDGPSAVMVCGSGHVLQVWDKDRYEALSKSPDEFGQTPWAAVEAAPSGVQ